MKKPSSQGIVRRKNSRPTLPVSLSTALVALCNLSDNALFVKVASACCPAVGWGLAYLFRFIWNEFQQKRLERLINGWITTLERERELPHTTLKRKKEIDEEIAGHRREIQRHQIDNFSIDYF